MQGSFRLRLVCVILDTCGQYFTSGSTKKKLDYYLLYFQRYYLFKRSCYPSTESFPLGMSQLFMDTVTGLKPKLEMYEDFEAACEAVLKVKLTIGGHLIFSYLRFVLFRSRKSLSRFSKRRFQSSCRQTQIIWKMKMVVWGR